MMVLGFALISHLEIRSYDEDPNPGNPGDPPAKDCDSKCRLRVTFAKRKGSDQTKLEGVRYFNKTCSWCACGSSNCCKPFGEDENIEKRCANKRTFNDKRDVVVEMLCDIPQYDFGMRQARFDKWISEDWVDSHDFNTECNNQ